MSDYSAKVHADGADTKIVESGGTIQVKSGGTLQVDSGATMTFPAASTSLASIVELALDAEAKLGTSTALATTPANLAAVLLSCKIGSFTGGSGASRQCTLTGAVIGDKVIGVAGITSGAIGIFSTSFETAITVTNKIVQSATGNLTGNRYICILKPVA